MKSAEARILEKIIGGNGRIVYDQGGAVLLEINGSPLNFFFVGKRYTSFTSDPYYVSIGVHVINRESRIVGEARIKIRHGILGFKKKLIIEHDGELGVVVNRIVRENRSLVLSSPYEELVVKRVFKGIENLNVNVENAIVIIGRTTIARMLKPYKFFYKLYDLNTQLLSMIINEIYQ